MNLFLSPQLRSERRNSNVESVLGCGGPSSAVQHAYQQSTMSSSCRLGSFPQHLLLAVFHPACLPVAKRCAHRMRRTFATVVALEVQRLRKHETCHGAVTVHAIFACCCFALCFRLGSLHTAESAAGRRKMGTAEASRCLQSLHFCLTLSTRSRFCMKRMASTLHSIVVIIITSISIIINASHSSCTASRPWSTCSPLPDEPAGCHLDEPGAARPM